MMDNFDGFLRMQERKLKEIPLPTMHFTKLSTPEVHDPQTYEEALDIVLGQMKQIMIDRHRKYGPNNILRSGVHGLITRMGDKLSRIENDHKDCSIGACYVKPIDFKDEAFFDAYLDLANYAGPIALMLQKGWWTLPLE